MSYAKGLDSIAGMEITLAVLDEQAEPLEKDKKGYENTIMFNIETEWEDTKAKHLSNVEKRRIAFEEHCSSCDELQSIIGKLKEIRKEQRKLKIELGNEHRAFQLLLKDE